MIVGTKYDTDLKEKVFVVRGDERYTHSTITTIAVTTVASNRSYLQVTLTASVKNHLGQSSVTFYDGDEVIGVVVCNSNQSSVNLTAHVHYGYHKFHAKYMGNAQCLSSKSGIEEITVTEPDLLHSEISMSLLQESYIASNSFTLTGHLYGINGTTVTGMTSKTVSLILNGTTFGTATTSSNGAFIFTISANALSEGTYNAQVSFDGDDYHLGCDEEFSFIISHDNCSITVTPKYSKIGIGDTATFIVAARTFKDEPLENETVTLNNGG